MNKTLQLKGAFEQRKNTGGGGAPNLPKGKTINSKKLKQLLNDLNRLYEFWSNEKILSGALINVYYNKIAAKSNRVQGLLTNGSIVGAKFYDDQSPKHVITHFISLNELRQAIKNLDTSINILEQQFNGQISHEQIKKINSKDPNEKIIINCPPKFKTIFLKILVDAYYVERFDVSSDVDELKTDSIITIYKTGEDTISLMNKLGIRVDNNRIIDNTTLYLYPDELNILKIKAPYLISMAVSDISTLTKSDFDFVDNTVLSIPFPYNEPTIGVIDTGFSNEVYFSDWVETTNLLPKEIDLTPNDYLHGTAVTSLIVDGPSLNPDLDDGCGRFKVKHFTVAAGDRFSSFSILKNIERIIASNPDVKVWNLSLGAKFEINPNFISPEAAILDKIQCKYDVVFVIAGTNKSDKEPFKMIGAPADSINSIVVNSVTHNGKPTTYTRTGPVLSFFIKPDIAYYGGDNDKKIKVYTNRGIEYVQGTSFAAPWIARKMCYLISILGLSREEAKALLIHSTTTWEKQKLDPYKIGHGVVPKRIEDVVNTPNDEIQFIISGISEEYDTYNYRIPVPIHQNKHPFIAKATLCYFPHCNRSQGVDYTNTELDIQFGRIKDNGIKSIDNNYQDRKGHYTWEKDARMNYRKWDNVKHIREIVKSRNIPRDVYSSKGLWGISLKTKNRLNSEDGKNLKFSIVVTLKELNGVNRIEDFIRNCLLNEWFVNKIDIENRVDIHNIAEEDIHFEE
ncbi:MAG: S8 family peptidase [Candidatus Gastranaerophilaceae bacterium]